jgi:putative ABC transport system permease protein
MPVIGVRPTTEMLSRRKLNLDEVLELRKLPHVVAADGGFQHVGQFRVGAVSVKYNGKKVAGTRLQGSTVQISQVTDLNFREGRLFTDQEDQRASHVCVLGYDTWQQLFGDESAVGKEVNVETGMYTVIGVVDKLKQPFGGGKNPDDNKVYFPLGTFHNLHPEDKDMWVSVKYDDPKYKSLVEEEIRERLRIMRKVRVDKPDDFEIFGPDSLSKLWGQLTGGLVLFMIAVSSVGLMVGGVGVMNIMLVSVTERTREIGVRKAIGATRKTILTQFTTEAVTLCAVGGIIGILVGAVLTYIVYFLPIGHLGADRVWRVLRHRAAVRDLPGVESRQPRSDRGAAVRVRQRTRDIGTQGLGNRRIAGYCSVGFLVPGSYVCRRLFENTVTM